MAVYLCGQVPIYMQFSTQVEDTVLLEEKIANTKDIILYNDDHNTFDHVIDCLVDICDHDPIQAEQCAYLVHHTGKCAVKKGSFTELEPLCTALHDRDLTAEIE